jgi:succinate dehydrogenase / fumarate reductase cytochrome b subunit
MQMNDQKEKTLRQFRNINILDIRHYRLPAAGLVSFLHRVSGALMFLLLPFILYLLEQSIGSENFFARLQDGFGGWFAKLVILALSWAYLHHFCAGVRHLFMDVHIGITKEASRKSAVSVLSVSVILTVAVALKLFGAF